MNNVQLAIYAKEKMYAAIGAVMTQSTTVLSLSQVLILMGIPELNEMADLEETE
jgi:hypothetical protein